MIKNSSKALKRKAFTMVEMVMVIIILGIVGMIGTDIIVKMYQGYIKSKIVNDLQQKTELLLEQITKRLQHRVKNTTIGRSSVDDSYLVLNDPAIGALNAGNGPDMIEWIGYDYESHIGISDGAYSTSGWSGFIDVNSTQTTSSQSFTPGSNLSTTRSVIKTLSYNTIDSNAGPSRPVILPKGYHNTNMSVYGWDGASGGDSNATFIIQTQTATDQTHMYYADIGDREIFEQYYLAWSAYALVPVANPHVAGKPDDFNLTLKYNYQPWYNEMYHHAKSQVLAEHVSTFRVMQVGDSIRVKVCINDDNITGTPYGFCKEKAIF